ncbi:MAG: hypothetical protein H7Y17_17615 [Chlorobia bacterium]|nr:hypothetical protein [Fimbriimonadaceae bacterium]
MKLQSLVAILLITTSAFAQSVAKVKPGTSTFKAIVLAAKKEFQKSAAHPIKTPSDIVRRAGNWAYVADRLAFVNPKHIGDGDGMALLKLKNGKWVVVVSEVGSGGMEEIAEEWTKRYKLPKGLANLPPL